MVPKLLFLVLLIGCVPGANAAELYKKMWAAEVLQRSTYDNSVEAQDLAQNIIEYSRPCRVRAHANSDEYGHCTFEFCWKKGLRVKRVDKPWFRIAQPHDILQGNLYRQVAVNITPDGRAGVCVSKDGDVTNIRSCVLYDDFLRRGLPLLISRQFIAEASGDLVGIHLGNASGKKAGIEFENYFLRERTVSSKDLATCLSASDGLGMYLRLGDLRRLKPSLKWDLFVAGTGLLNTFNVYQAWSSPRPNRLAFIGFSLGLACELSCAYESYAIHKQFSDHLKECKKKLKKRVIKNVLANNS